MSLTFSPFIFVSYGTLQQTSTHIPRSWRIPTKLSRNASNKVFDYDHQRFGRQLCSYDLYISIVKFSIPYIIIWIKV